MASLKPRKKNFIYGISKYKLEKEINELGVHALFIKFGKVRTNMSKDHIDPPFTLDKTSATNLLMNSIDKRSCISNIRIKIDGNNNKNLTCGNS